MIQQSVPSMTESPAGVICGGVRRNGHGARQSSSRRRWRRVAGGGAERRRGASARRRVPTVDIPGRRAVSAVTRAAGRLLTNRLRQKRAYLAVAALLGLTNAAGADVASAHERCQAQHSFSSINDTVRTGSSVTF